MSEDLKPCPFCGGEAMVDTYSYNEGIGIAFYIVCPRCGCTTKTDDSEPPVAVWNTRSGLAIKELVDALELAQLWLCNSMPIGDFITKNPKPLPVIAAALAKYRQETA